MKREGQILIEIILSIFLLIWLVPKVQEWTGPTQAEQQAMKDAVDSNDRILTGH